jgi:hypothetical protein
VGDRDKASGLPAPILCQKSIPSHPPVSVSSFLIPLLGIGEKADGKGATCVTAVLGIRWVQGVDGPPSSCPKVRQGIRGLALGHPLKNV